MRGAREGGRAGGGVAAGGWRDGASLGCGALYCTVPKTSRLGNDQPKGKRRGGHRCEVLARLRAPIILRAESLFWRGLCKDVVFCLWKVLIARKKNQRFGLRLGDLAICFCRSSVGPMDLLKLLPFSGASCSLPLCSSSSALCSSIFPPRAPPLFLVMPEEPIIRLSKAEDSGQSVSSVEGFCTLNRSGN